MPRYIQSPKFVGIIHEYGGDSDNVDACGEFCRLVAQYLPNVVPLSPLHMFAFLDDCERNERRLGIRLWRVVMSRCDEVWTVGACGTEGCRGDLAACEESGVPVFDGPARMDELCPDWRLASLPEVV
jgi:hypothetical protein